MSQKHLKSNGSVILGLFLLACSRKPTRITPTFVETGTIRSDLIKQVRKYYKSTGEFPEKLSKLKEARLFPFQTRYGENGKLSKVIDDKIISTYNLRVVTKNGRRSILIDYRIEKEMFNDEYEEFSFQ